MSTEPGVAGANGAAPCREIVFTVFEDKYTTGIFDRREIYEEIWAQTLSRTAAKYGIGSHHLKMICDAMGVPTPSSIYWHQKDRGLSPERPPLPEAGDEPNQVRVKFKLKPDAKWKLRRDRDAPKPAPQDEHDQARTVDRKPSVKSKYLSTLPSSKLKYDPTCSFCGKYSTEVRKLVEGPKDTHTGHPVWICDECVKLCNEIVEYEPESEVVISANEKHLHKAFRRLEDHVRAILKIHAKLIGTKTEVVTATLDRVRLDTEAVLAILHAELAVGRLVDEDHSLGQRAINELRASVETLALHIVMETPKVTQGRHSRIPPEVAQRVLRELGVSASQASAQRALDDLVNHNDRSE